MKDFFKKILSDEKWLIEAEGFRQNRQGSRESQFALGNGYMGIRGVLEEMPAGSSAGTYIAGLYDNTGAMVTELVNAPNPIDFRIVVEGEKLDIGRMNIDQTERVLDLKKGILVRRTVFSDTRKRRFLYESLRFFSLRDMHIGAMQVYLKALDNIVNLFCIKI